MQGCRPTPTGIQGVEATGILTYITTGGVAGTNVSKTERMARQATLDIDPVLV